MDFAEVTRRRRMVRSFSEEPVTPEQLDGVVGAAIRAPSAGNVGGWDLVVLEGTAQTELFWESTTTPAWRVGSRRWAGLRRAPVVVVVFCHPDAYLARYGEPDKAGADLADSADSWPIPYWHFDAGVAVSMMLLGAVEQGLGACFLGNFRGEEELRRALGVPADRRYAGAVLVGHPEGDDPPSTSARRPGRDHHVVHRAQW